MDASNEVLRGLIIALAGLNIGLNGLAIAFYVRATRSVPKDERTLPASLVGMLVGKILLVFLMSRHVYAHLQDNSAETWELWLGLAALIIGTVSLTMFTRRKDPKHWVSRETRG